jgi:ubiquinone/menaquinone biosynthesis C-methylase UbiE
MCLVDALVHFSIFDIALLYYKKCCNADSYMIQLIRKIYYFLPVQWRFLWRKVLFFPLDIITYSKRKKAGIPPAGKMFIGSGNFVLTGNRFAQRLKQYANLQADSKVLDIGCGIGRLARPLTQIVAPPGEYKGFDVVKSGIDWCTQNISNKYPHFHFLYTPLSNDLYNSGGQNAGEFVFPYKDNTFTIAAAISVYTHLLPHETNRYLAETARVLQPGGIAFFTFFIHDGQQPLPASFNFPIQYHGYSLMSEKVTRANVLYQHSYLIEMIEQNGLTIKEWVKGRWNTPTGIDLQDTLVLVKK